MARADCTSEVVGRGFMDNGGKPGFHIIECSACQVGWVRDRAHFFLPWELREGPYSRKGQCFLHFLLSFQETRPKTRPKTRSQWCLCRNSLAGELRLWKCLVQNLWLQSAPGTGGCHVSRLVVNSFCPLTRLTICIPHSPPWKQF